MAFHGIGFCREGAGADPRRARRVVQCAPCVALSRYRQGTLAGAKTLINHGCYSRFSLSGKKWVIGGDLAKETVCTAHSACKSAVPVPLWGTVPPLESYEVGSARIP